MARWGKAGVRLTEQEAEQRGRAAVAARNRRKLVHTGDTRIAYQLWRAGELKPYLITLALDARGLDGPQVDIECGGQEPDVDLWEAGKRYPTWRQLCLLAKLTEKTPRFLCSNFQPLRPEDTSMRFHTDFESPPRVWAFDPEAVRATVAGTPATIPPQL